MADQGEREGSTQFVPRSGPSSVGCVLRVVSGPDKGKSLDLPEGKVEIGGSSDCGLVLTDGTVSGRHLRVEVTDEGLKVTDLGSTNGTLYLETKVREVVVAPGAVLHLGNTQLALAARQDTSTVEPDEHVDNYGSIVGRSAAMQQLYSKLKRVERVEHTVLVVGDTGVGKELVAKEIHRNSPRKNGPYEIFDCGAVPPNLIESELFGHVKGAFTGAERNRTGVFENAKGGTVFLDEIGELPLELQPKLLRVMENRTIRRVGDNQTHPVDVRLVAATNRDLMAEVEAGRFRSDLYYRLAVVELLVPPLRERREDIPHLARHFLEQDGFGAMEISPETLELLTSGYEWPGNVRELSNAIARVVALGSLPQQVTDAQTGDSASGPVDIDPDQPFLEAKKRLVDSFERDYLTHQLQRSNNNIAEAARMSGMDRAYLRRLLIRHGLLPSGKG